MKSINNQQSKYDVVYICHAKKDEKLANKTIELLLDIGLTEQQIISPFVANYSTPLGVDRYEYISDVLNKRVLVLHLITNNTYEDIICNQDIGAISALKCDYVSIISVDFLSVPDNAIDPRKQTIDMRDSEQSIRIRLGELKNKLEDTFSVRKISEIRWEQRRDDYIVYARSTTTSSVSSPKTDCFDDDIKNVIDALGKKALFTSESIESLGYTKAKSRIIIETLIGMNRIKKETVGRYRWIK